MVQADSGLRPRSAAASQGMLDGLDLRGEFWALQ